MSLDRTILVLLLSLLVGTGCRATPARIVQAPALPVHRSNAPVAPSHSADTSELPSRIIAAAYDQAEAQSEANIPHDGAANFSDELSSEELIEEVQTIHPSVEAMYAAWQAAADRYPQVVSLEDPMLGATFAPSSFGSPTVESAYALELSQKLPLWGKRALRGAVASAEADSADRDVETTRQKLAEVAALAFWDYYVTRQQIALNQQSAGILQSFRENAQSRYQSGLVTSQDVFQADIELANLEQRGIELDRLDKVAAARINVLLRRRPTDPLPPPPKSVLIEYQLPDQDVLLAFAVEQRPEVAAAAARVQAAHATLDLTYKDYYPDAELFGRYDTFWQPADTQSDLRSQVGFRINMPIYRNRLNAAACAASHQVARAHAEMEQLILEIQSDVQSAYEQVRESQRTLDLYSQKLLPAAEQNLSAGRANYDASKVNFLDLATAQRQLIDARERQLQSQVELQRRLAMLRRVSGGSLPEELPPPVPADP